jgi:hypothetical protein
MTLQAIADGYCKACIGPDWFFTWREQNGALHIADAVGDFADVYPRIFEQAAKAGFPAVTFTSDRPKPFERRLRSLGYSVGVTHQENGLNWLKVEVSENGNN